MPRLTCFLFCILFDLDLYLYRVENWYMVFIFIIFNNNINWLKVFLINISSDPIWIPSDPTSHRNPRVDKQWFTIMVTGPHRKKYAQKYISVMDIFIFNLLKSSNSSIYQARFISSFVTWIYYFEANCLQCVACMWPILTIIALTTQYENFGIAIWSAASHWLCNIACRTKMTHS